MIAKPDRRRGQAVILVTFALIAMCGLLGLAVDLGWAYFVKKSAQASADAGALAAAQNVLAIVGQTQNFPTEFGYSSGACSSEGQDYGLSAGCKFAQQSGFAGTVSMTSGVGSTPPTVPNMQAPWYWATARAVQTIPQLFSAVLGHPAGISSARATAAIVTIPINGALHTLNRQYDLIAGSGLSQGTDVGGSGSIIVPTGLVMSSQSANAGSGPGVTGPITIVSPGKASGLGSSSITDVGDSGQFLDPFRDMGQPALPSPAAHGAILPTYGVINGNFASGVYPVSSNNGTIQGVAIPSPYPSGNYVAINNCGACATGTAATLAGVQITLTQSAAFSDSTPTCYPTTSSTFGCFFFYGGLTVSSGVTVTMGAGEFIMVGGGPAGVDFSAPAGAFLNSQVTCTTPSACSTAGVMLIMTGSSSAITCSGSGCTNANGDLYPNLATQISSNPLLKTAATTTNLLNFGSVSLLAGADSSGHAVTGIVAKNLPANFPPSNPLSLANTLGPFDGVVVWQDQANSAIEYARDGSGNIAICSANIDYACAEPGHVSGTEAMTLRAISGTGLQGVVYQPRGAYLRTGSGNIQGPIQIITGAVSMQGGGAINITLPPTSVKRRVVALVE
jgi:hypothetical protein